MARTTFRATACLVILSAWTLNSSFAQTQPTTTNNPGGTSASMSTGGSQAAQQRTGQGYLDEAEEASAPAPFRASTPARPVQQAGFHHAGVYTHWPIPVPAPMYLPQGAAQITPNGYPSLNAPLYPVPLPNIPYQTGGSLITNQALDPHEFLYPHTYRSIYPPYYYQVSGAYKVFPWGVSQSERWRLRGTLVTVKYNSSISPCSGFFPLWLK